MKKKIGDMTFREIKKYCTKRKGFVQLYFPNALPY